MHTENFRAYGTDEHPVGPFVVLSDGSTYGGANGGAVVCYITKKGLEQLESGNDFKHVDVDEIEFVSIRDLLHCWNASDHESKGHRWDCEESPSGFCQYDDIEDPAWDSCIHCNDPYERK